MGYNVHSYKSKYVYHINLASCTCYRYKTKVLSEYINNNTLREASHDSTEGYSTAVLLPIDSNLLDVQEFDESFIPDVSHDKLNIQQLGALARDTLINLIVARNPDVTIKLASKKEEVTGIDFWVNKIPIQVKADMRAGPRGYSNSFYGRESSTTGNVYIEMDSVNKLGRYEEGY